MHFQNFVNNKNIQTVFDQNRGHVLLIEVLPDNVEHGYPELKKINLTIIAF